MKPAAAFHSQLGSCRPRADTAGLASFHMGGKMHWVTLPMMHFCLAQGGGWGIPRVSVTAWETPLSHRWRHQSRDPPAVGVMRYTTSDDCDMSTPVIAFCGLFTWSCFLKTSCDSLHYFFLEKTFLFPWALFHSQASLDTTFHVLSTTMLSIVLMNSPLLNHMVKLYNGILTYYTTGDHKWYW